MTEDFEKRISEAAAALKRAGAHEVYLFGSTAHGGDNDCSDIDLAVSGLPPEVFFRAMGQARRILKRSLDLVDLDESNPFTNYLKESGTLQRVG